MTGDEHRVVTHGLQALGDAVEQILVIALRKIGAAYAAGKQHVTYKSAFQLWRIKHHMARGVARAVAPKLTVSPSLSHRVGVKARDGGKP